MTFMIFPDAKTNESLLGMDFIKTAGFHFDFSLDIWNFPDQPECNYTLEYEPFDSQVAVSCAEIVRADEGVGLIKEEKDLLAEVINNNQDVFEPGGAPTPFTVHHINTGDIQPISVPPYRLTPARKELL